MAWEQAYTMSCAIKLIRTPCISLPAMDDNRFIPSVLLCSYDLVDEVDHPRPCAWSSILWPGGEVKLLHHLVLVVSGLQSCMDT